MDEALLSIIIINYNNPQLIAKCLETIDANLVNIGKEVVIVDNNSKIHNLDRLENLYEYVKVIYLCENMGFGYANNIGVKNSKGKALLLLNSDTELIDSSLVGVANDFMSANDLAIWGVKLIWPNGSFQNSYSKEITFLNFVLNYTPLCFLSHYFWKMKNHKYSNSEFNSLTEVDAIYGTAMLIRRIDYENLGGFSKKYFMYFEDIDLCDRFRKEHGGNIFYNPKSTIIHNVMGSSSRAKLNFNFLKSKYIYGIGKFGPFLMMLYIGLDLSLLLMTAIARKFLSRS